MDSRDSPAGSVEFEDDRREVLEEVSDLIYEFWYAGLQGVAAQKKICLRECMKTAEAIYYMEETQLRQFEFLNERERNRIIQAQKIRDFGSQ